MRKKREAVKKAGGREKNQKRHIRWIKDDEHVIFQGPKRAVVPAPCGCDDDVYNLLYHSRLQDE